MQCCSILAVAALAALTFGGEASAQFTFKHHFGDSDLKGRNMAQTALAD